MKIFQIDEKHFTELLNLPASEEEVVFQHELKKEINKTISEALTVAAPKEKC